MCIPSATRKLLTTPPADLTSRRTRGSGNAGADHGPGHRRVDIAHGEPCSSLEDLDQPEGLPALRPRRPHCPHERGLALCGTCRVLRPAGGQGLRDLHQRQSRRRGPQAALRAAALLRGLRKTPLLNKLGRGCAERPRDGALDGLLGRGPRRQEEVQGGPQKELCVLAHVQEHLEVVGERADGQRGVLLHHTQHRRQRQEVLALHGLPPSRGEPQRRRRCLHCRGTAGRRHRRHGDQCRRCRGCWRGRRGG
mmetsp:Transcript_45514/g.142832  ORF Transcript_45514/g.142832 Transcript_45514/m.142832 type:complete len:251 (-) Transcript_45514:22-774(-)